MKLSKKSKHIKIILGLLLVSFVFSLCPLIKGTNVSAYSTYPTMDSSWGFSFTPLQVPTRYWQYGSMSWSSAIQGAQAEFSASPANVSLSVSSSYSYNNTNIRVSSNYWSDVSWAGVTTQSSSDVYSVELNSTYGSNETKKKLVATHEICHAFGLNDCQSSSYLMYYSTGGSATGITTYENELFIDRYGSY